MVIIQGEICIFLKKQDTISYNHEFYTFQQKFSKQANGLPYYK